MSSLYRVLFQTGVEDPNQVRDIIKHVYSQRGVEVIMRGAGELAKEALEYFKSTGEIPSKGYLETVLNDENKLKLEALSSIPFPSFSEAKKLLQREKTAVEIEETASALQSSIKILKEGDKRGKAVLKGPHDARSYAIQAFSQVQELFGESFPAGDLREHALKLIHVYDELKKEPDVGCLSGIAQIDEATYGARNGQLWLISAFTSEGKTMFMVNMMWYNAVILGRNTVYASGEMTKDEIDLLLVARHSYHPKFEKIHPPIKITEILEGGLTQSEEKFYKEVLLPDLHGNPDYGKLYTFQLPTNATPEDIWQFLQTCQSQFPIECFFLDRMELLSYKGRSYGNYSIELGEIIKAVKQMALNFNNGAGLPVVSAFQINRASREEAEETEEYTNRALALTAEAEKSSDVIIWILRLQKYIERHEVKMGIVKNRKAGRFPKFFSFEDYESAYLGPLEDDPLDLLGTPTGDGTTEVSLGG